MFPVPPKRFHLLFIFFVLSDETLDEEDEEEEGGLSMLTRYASGSPPCPVHIFYFIEPFFF